VTDPRLPELFRDRLPEDEVAAANPPVPQRRLADRLLDAGEAVARSYVEQDRWDPNRPTLSSLVASTLAEHERIGEERVNSRIRALIEQRTKLRDERLGIARKRIEEGNLPVAASELRWAADLDQQIGALRLLLITP
jgi:hypothetical protein